MSGHTHTANDQGPAHWPFMLGLGLITLATITNFALAGMTRYELETLPPILAIPYEWGGRLGVTAILVALGLAVMVGGYMSHVMQTRGRRPETWAEHARRYGTLMTGAPRGAVPLETAKYLTPPGPMMFAEECPTGEAGESGAA